MKQVFNAGGEIVVTEIPSPVCGEGEVSVANAFSLISPGTESAALKRGTKGITGLVEQVRDNPELIRRAINMTRKEGLGKTLGLVQRQVAGNLRPLGYSSSGVVRAVGGKINDIAVGDRVACAGAGYASHADIITVPRNLLCRVPETVGLDEAAFTTLGAVALQGVRRAGIQIGEQVAVIGLGLLGQLTCQLVRAGGARVIGIDTDEARIKLAGAMGQGLFLVSGQDTVATVLQNTGGYGADTIIICAATPSSEPVRQAMAMARRKGRVVVVGSVGMELERSPFYEKELDFLIATSYGPGRYDSIYEEKGIDYPIAYVRWTENRNMIAFLDLLAQKKLNVRELIRQVFPIAEAGEAYRALGAGGSKPAVLFQYSVKDNTETNQGVVLPPEKSTGRINVAVIGAGNFGRAYHLPNLKRIPEYEIRAIVTRAGEHARSLAVKYGARYGTTDFRDVLLDKDIGMVLIATRHDQHARLIVEAAGAGKNIFVEKPIALNLEDCRRVFEAVNANKVKLTIGFNRRFAPLAQALKKLIPRHDGGLVINMRVNAPGFDRDDWINDPVEGGGAILGEAVHFFDLAGWLVGKEPARIYAEMISTGNTLTVPGNNIVCTLKFNDGSIASLTYTTVGNASFDKERIEVFAGGGVMVIDDFRRLTVTGLAGKGTFLPRTEKGHFELLQAYGLFLNGEGSGEDLPDVRAGVRATICALKVQDALRSGQVQEFSYPW